MSISPTSALRQRQLQRRLARLERHIAGLRTVERRFPWLRLGAFLAGSVAILLAYRSGPGPGFVAVVAALGLFGWAVSRHRRVDARIHRAELVRQGIVTQLARLALDWKALPPAQVFPVDAGHPFAADLDLLGERSLHRLIDQAASRGGSQRLAGWLMAPVPEVAQIQRRQAIVRALLPLQGFRSRLALNSALVVGNDGQWDGEALRAWLERPTRPEALRRALLVLAALAVLNVGLLLGSLVAGLPAWWLLSLLVYGGIYLSRQADIRALFDDALHLDDTLRAFGAVSAYLEQYPYPREGALAQACRPFWDNDLRPSRQLARLTGLVAGAGLQRNMVLWLPVNLLLPWDLFFAYQLSRSRMALRALLPAWLETWYELEALNSLASFAELHPEYRFPEIDAVVGEGPLLVARSIGHPLLPAAGKVRNDFSLEHIGQITIITGSNMSGKSTFLRTLGVNLCLAYAGGPVDAAGLHLVPLRLFTCLNVSDSVTDGISYFYAEVRRLKALLEALEEPHPFPLFFLVDEIFRGTNNRERQIGGQAYVRALVDSRGVGVISTHDLELARLADQVEAVRNAHFREEVVEGRMSFDYRLRPGPCPTTNALRIMQLAGLPVGDGRTEPASEGGVKK